MSRPSSLASRRRRQRLLVDEARQTEVRHLDDGRGEVLLSEKKVFGLDIAMDDAQFVAVIQGVENGRNNITSLRLSEPLSLEDLVEKLKESRSALAVRCTSERLTSPPIISSMTRK